MRILSTDFFFSIIRIATPILFATLAAVIGEKGGVSNIGLEGIMMMSALFGSLGAYWSNSWLVGLLIAMGIGVVSTGPDDAEWETAVPAEEDDGPGQRASRLNNTAKPKPSGRGSFVAGSSG